MIFVDRFGVSEGASNAFFKITFFSSKIKHQTRPTILTCCESGSGEHLKWWCVSQELCPLEIGSAGHR